METTDTYQESSVFEGCLYGSVTRSNRTFFTYHAISLVLALSIASNLLFSSNLRRFYAPLARIANAGLFLQVCSDVAYFLYFPYILNQGNCCEMIIERLYMACVMFGELHQIYLLANMLGLGNHKFTVGPEMDISLDNFLKISTLSIIVSMLYATYVYHSFTLVRNLWCIFVCYLQIYFIRLASTNSKDSNRGAISVALSSIRIYEKLSILQLLPATICFTERVCYLFGVDLIHHFDAATLILDVVCNFVFYLKIILIQENSDVQIEVVNMHV